MLHHVTKNLTRVSINGIIILILFLSGLIMKALIYYYGQKDSFFCQKSFNKWGTYVYRCYSAMQVCISVTQNVFSLCEQAFRVSSEEYFIFIWAYLLVFGVLYQPDWSMGIDLCTSYIATQHIYFYQLANNWSLLPSLWGISKLRKKQWDYCTLYRTTLK